MEESYIFYRDICINNYLSNDEQLELMKFVSCDDDVLRGDAIKKLTLANIGLVHKAVSDFMWHNDKIPYDDLMSLGVLGILNSIDKYDSSKGKISTFIYTCVRRNLKEFEKSNSVVSIEKHFYSKMSSYVKCIDQYYKKNGNCPSLNYIKDTTGLSDLDILLIQTTHTDSISLSEPIDDDITLMDCVVDEGSSIQKIVELRELKSILRKNLSKLSDVEIKILSCRYGLDNNEPMTQDEVAKLFNYSHQNISRLEHKALTKLKKIKDLKKYYYA